MHKCILTTGEPQHVILHLLYNCFVIVHITMFSILYVQMHMLSKSDLSADRVHMGILFSLNGGGVVSFATAAHDHCHVLVLHGHHVLLELHVLHLHGGHAVDELHHHLGNGARRCAIVPPRHLQLQRWWHLPRGDDTACSRRRWGESRRLHCRWGIAGECRAPLCEPP